MASYTCEDCGFLVGAVPYIPDHLIGQRPQYLETHFKDGRKYVGKRCPGSGRHIPVVAERRVS